MMAVTYHEEILVLNTLSPLLPINKRIVIL